MINPFLADGKTRLDAWKACRLDIARTPLVKEQLHLCLAFWQQAPLENHVLNWDDCTTWPTAWELIETNSYCTSAHSLAVAYTLILADSDQYQNLLLKLITDRQNSLQKIVVDTHGWILNHGYLDKTPENSLQHVYTHQTWKWTGKQWQAQ